MYQQCNQQCDGRPSQESPIGHQSNKAFSKALIEADIEAE